MNSVCLFVLGVSNWKDMPTPGPIPAPGRLPGPGVGPRGMHPGAGGPNKPDLWGAGPGSNRPWGEPDQPPPPGNMGGNGPNPGNSTGWGEPDMKRNDNLGWGEPSGTSGSGWGAPPAPRRNPPGKGTLALKMPHWNTILSSLHMSCLQMITLRTYPSNDMSLFS